MKARGNFLIPFLLVVLTFGAFWRVLLCDFINYDDPEYVLKNAHVQSDFSRTSVAWAFKAVYQGTYQPMVWLSYLADWNLYGLHPWGFHLTNLVLHVVAVLLLFATLSRATGSPWRSALAAGFFAVHPTRIESVAWIAERKDVLSSLFWMLTMLTYVQYVETRRLSRLGWAMTCFVLGLMAKPMLVTLPFVLLLLDYWPLGRFQNETIRKLVLEKITFLLIALLFAGVAYYAQKVGGAISSLESVRLSARLANASISYVRYLQQFLWPRELAVIYPHPGNAVSVNHGIAAFAVLGVLTLGMLKVCKSQPFVWFGWLWYLVTLLPVIGIVQFGTHAMADRFTYIPFIGLFVITAWGVPTVLCGRNASACPVVRFAAPCSLIALAACTSIQLGYWKNSVTLFTRALAVTHNNYVAHLNLGTALADRGEFSRAVPHFTMAVRLYPDQPGAHFNLANALFMQGDIMGAIQHYRETLRLDPRFPNAAFNLQAAEARLRAPHGGPTPVIRSRRREAAIKHFKEGVRLESKGDTTEAAKEYREAIRLDPNLAEAHCNLGVILKDQGKLDEAISEYRKAIRIKPEFAEAHGNLAVALFLEGDYAEAWKEVKLCRKYGVEPHPDFVRALQDKMPEPTEVD